MMIYDKRSEKKICHYSNCPEVSYIPYEERGYISAYDAKKECYEICEECNLLARMVNAEKDSIEKVCSLEGISIRMDFDKIKVKSPLSEWLIVIGGYNKNLYLHHKNDIGATDREDTRISGYHPHPDRSETITGMLRHIAHHDNYRIDNEHITEYKPRENNHKYGSKKWKAENKREKNREIKHSIRATLKALNAIKAEAEREERRSLAAA